MQEDNFLQNYKQAWQQDNKAMERLVDIPLETLHENIARYERRKRSRKIVWMTVSAAACLAFAVTTGIRYLTPEADNGNQTLVAENRTARPEPTPEHTHQLSAYPTKNMTTAALTENARTSHKTNRNVVSAYRSTEDGIIAATATPAIEEVMPVDVQPDDIVPTKPSVPSIGANAIETTRLVAMGETTTPVIEVETDGLVKITAPSRNTFHEAIVEPLLALVTYDM